jgi:hypothetical protein
MTPFERKRGLFLAVVVGLTLMTVGTFAKGGPPKSTPDLVTSTLFDADLSGGPVQVQSDDSFVPGPGSATYSAGVDGVISQIDTDKIDWNLDLRNSSRGFYLTLTKTDGSPVPGFPIGATFYSGRIISRCFLPAGGTQTISWLDIAGADPNCAMRVNFTSGTTNYTLVMSPLYPGTGLAEVYCNVVDGGSCVDWTDVVNLNAPNASVANLYSIAKNGSEKFVAACKLSFRVHVTYP